MIDFGNLMKLEQTKVYGGIGEGTMGYFPDTGSMIYSEAFQIKFSCPFRFQNFPFDSHKCCLEYGAFKGDTRIILLEVAHITYGNMTTNEGLISLKHLPFSFDLKIESQPSFEKVKKLDGKAYSFSYTGICFTMNRNSYGQLLGGFYYSTLSFAVLSLVSYLIKPDIVST